MEHELNNPIYTYIQTSTPYQQFLIQMGICTSDPLGYLIKEYGPDVCKYIVAIKAEDFLDETAPKLTDRIQETLKNTAGNLDKEFDAKEATIKNNFNSTVSSIKQSNPSVLEAAKSSQNKSEQQLLGYNNIQSQFTKIKSLKDEKIKGLQTNIIKTLKDQIQNLKKGIQQSRPSLPLFDQMPICLRKKVISEGEAKFAPQIKQKQEQLMNIIDRVTNVNNLEADIKRVVGLNEIDNLVKNSSSVFQTAKRMLTGVGGLKSGSCFG